MNITSLKKLAIATALFIAAANGADAKRRMPASPVPAQPHEAQQAITRYVRQAGIADLSRIHGYMLNKYVLVRLLQLENCYAVRIVNGIDKDGYPVAMYIPVDGRGDNMEVSTIWAEQDMNLCPVNCDFSFIADKTYKPHRIKPAIRMTSGEAKAAAGAYGTASGLGMNSFIIQKDPMLVEKLINTEYMALRIYLGTQSGESMPGLYIAGVNQDGSTDWNGPVFFEDASNICQGACY